MKGGIKDRRIGSKVRVEYSLKKMYPKGKIVEEVFYVQT